MNKRAVFVTGLMALLTFILVGSLAPISPAFATSPPEVACVQAFPQNPAVAHDTWSGRLVTLKCVAHDAEGDHTLANYEWDFGDGSPPQSGVVGDPYAIEASHAYAGAVGDLFIATATVWDTDGNYATDQYLVQIKDGADLTVQVNVAIDEGLWRLHKDLARDTLPGGEPVGAWWYGGNTAASTAAATEAFEVHGSLPSGDPAVDPYVETVQRGLNYLFTTMQSYPVALDPDLCPMGDPDSNANGIGLLACTDCWHGMYESGIVLMAVASSRCPTCVAASGGPDVAGRTYLDVAQDMVDYLAYGQSDPVTGVSRGGWRYYGNFREWGEGQASDNSVAQWPVIGMESAEVNFGPAGLIVPQFVRDELEFWIDYIQNDVDGDWADGGSGYAGPWDWVNVAKTGGLLAEMKFVGDDLSSTRLQDAVNYIEANWTTDGEHFASNSYYAFYSLMKGFRLNGIKSFNPINDPGAFDWYSDPSWGYAQHIVDDQQADGAWYGGYWSNHPLTSAWAILTLKKTVVQPGPVADAGPDVPSHPPIVEITFDGRASYHRDAERSIVQYIWDFGDGSPPVEGAVVKHGFPAVYNPDGSIDWGATTRDYVVTLTVVDDSQPPLSDTDSLVVHITPPPYPPVADANGPYVSYPCRLVILDGSGSYDANGALYPDPSHPWYGYITAWEWDLDNDGEYDDAAGEFVPWSECAPGVYVVGLRVTNNYGETDEVDTVINVATPPPAVALDIKPQSCPNPFNFKDKGLIAVAVPGSAELDVTTIDPVTVRLASVPPVKWAYEDVAAPYEPYLGKSDVYDCTEAGPDGYVDLVLFYDAQELAVVIGFAEDGDALTLWIDGMLKEEFGGQAFTGQDVVKIIRKGKS